MIIQIAYTNSNCQDVWKMFINQNQKHTEMQLCLLTDEYSEEKYNLEEGNVLIYDNKDPYYKIWIEAVQKFGGNYFIYLQEDFILYDDVNQEKINEYVEFLKNNPQYSFIRLLKSGQLFDKKLSETLYEIESTNVNVFAMQPTIWKSVDYIKLMNTVKSKGWLETDADYRTNIAMLGIKGAYHYDNEPKRGSAHYDSNVYPYIATALIRGKWNTGEYRNQLNELLLEYKININERGII